MKFEIGDTIAHTQSIAKGFVSILTHRDYRVKDYSRYWMHSTGNVFYEVSEVKTARLVLIEKQNKMLQNPENHGSITFCGGEEYLRKTLL